MVLEVAILNVRTGQTDAFEAAFREAQSILASMPGYQRHELRRCIEASGRYLLLVWWDTLESHTRGFRQSAGYARWRELLHHFSDPFPEVEHYTPVAPSETAEPTTPIESAAVFVVRDLGASVAYFRDALGFDVAFSYGEPAFYAGVCRGAVTIHLQAASQTQRPAGAVRLYVFVASADAVHRELVGRGARIMNPPASYPYGMRDFDVADPDGNSLVFGSPEPTAAG